MSSTATTPDVLVSTDWVAQHLNDPGLRIVEVDVDTAAYDQGHVPNALAWNWTTELCDTLVRDIIPKDKFEALMARSGISNDTTVILYGDNNNWFAAWAYWLASSMRSKRNTSTFRKWKTSSLKVRRRPWHASTWTMRRQKKPSTNFKQTMRISSNSICLT